MLKRRRPIDPADREVLERMQRALAVVAAWRQEDKLAVQTALLPYHNHDHRRSQDRRVLAQALIEATHDLALLAGYLLTDLQENSDVDVALAALGHRIAEAIQ